MIRQDARTGIQRVVRAVWSRLNERSGCEFDVLPVYATKNHGYCYAPRDFLDRKSAFAPVPVRIATGDKFLGLDLTAHLLPKYRAQVRGWRERGASVNVIVYDLLPLLRPDWFTSAAVRNFGQWYAMLQSDVDQAICISNDVARQLRRLFRQSDRQLPVVTHIPMGSDVESSLPTIGIDSEVLKLLDGMRERRAVLMVGTIEPRKGYDAALRAFDYLWSKSGGEAPDLVIVGKPGWKTDGLQQAIRAHAQHGRRLHWLQAVSDEALGRLYAASAGLLLASHGEGFGLPLLEAVKHGCPVLARDLMVFREQGLPNVSYFQDDEPEALGNAILQLVCAPPLSATHTLRLPTWSDSVDELLRHLGLNHSERLPVPDLPRAVNVA